jgi:hypothetical protein
MPKRSATVGPGCDEDRCRILNVCGRGSRPGWATAAIWGLGTVRRRQLLQNR